MFWTQPWMTEASCSSVNTELFFPEGKAASETRLVRRVCAACPVRQECLDYALEWEQGWGEHVRYGIWGGLGPSQRYKLDTERGSRHAARPLGGAA